MKVKGAEDCPKFPQCSSHPPGAALASAYQRKEHAPSIGSSSLKDEDAGPKGKLRVSAYV